ncbi:MAG TPA: glycosyltransferase family 39 protein [Myxococcota bacterium]|nr:glycosyltransferase family 39 protein [Myxococcota bacterium]
MRERFEFVALVSILAALTFALWIGLDTTIVGRISEARCVNVVRGMLESGDWLVPRLGDTLRLQKPPLFYWAGAVVAKLSGNTAAWPVRAVSASAALGLALLIFAWGRSLGGAAEGLLALGSLAAMQQFTSSGRRGDAEMLLALLSTAALFAFYRFESRRERSLWPFALCAGLAFLTKATAIVFTIALPILAYLALQGELGALRRPRAWKVFAVVAAIGLSWYVAVLVFVPGAFEAFRDALLLPLGDSDSHSGSAHFKAPWWYLSVLPVRAAPASLLLPFVVWQLWRTRLYRGEPGRRFAALAFVVPFLAFSFLPQKQKHYTLSMIPGLALCSADALRAAARELGSRFGWLVRGIGPLLAAAGLAVAIWIALFYLWVESLEPLGVALRVGLPIALFAVAGLAALFDRRPGFGLSWLLGLLVLAGIGRGEVELQLIMLSRTYMVLSIDDRERLAAVRRDHEWFAISVLKALEIQDDD